MELGKPSELRSYESQQHYRILICNEIMKYLEQGNGRNLIIQKIPLDLILP